MDSTVPGAASIDDAMAAIWKELLELEDLASDTYFLDLGGNSMQANIFVGRIQEDFGVELSVEQVFDLNLAELSALARDLQLTSG